MSSIGSSSQGWEPPTPEHLHELLPQYEISAMIGRGGMGAVYRGTQASLGRDVAIKVLSEAFTEEESNDELKFAERFRQEARAMASLDHPAIISVYDFGETSEGHLYFVMEFVEGMDIHQFIRHNGGKLEQEHALSITAHVLEALDYAHAHGVVHRDIKPANILLNQEGRVKIADFGLAKTLAAADDEEDRPQLTMTDVAIGTPDFLAPEALEHGRVSDHRADLYAVGVMLYNMLTGTIPRGRFKAPTEHDEEIDERLDAIIEKALQNDPDDRYANSADFRADLDPVITSPMSKIKARETAHVAALAAAASESSAVAKSKRSRATVWIVAGIAAVAVVGAIVAFLPGGEVGPGDEAEGEEIADMTEGGEESAAVVKPSTASSTENASESDKKASAPAERPLAASTKKAASDPSSPFPLPIPSGGQGPLRGVGLGLHGVPVDFSAAEEFDDFIRVGANGRDIWVALRATGETVSNMPECSGLKEVRDFAFSGGSLIYLTADGSVHGTGGFSRIPPGLNNVVDLDVATDWLFCLHQDGTVTTWAHRIESGPLSEAQAMLNQLQDIVSIGGGFKYIGFLNSDGEAQVFQASRDGISKVEEIDRQGTRAFLTGHNFFAGIDQEGHPFFQGYVLELDPLPDRFRSKKFFDLRIGLFALAARDADGRWHIAEVIERKDADPARARMKANAGSLESAHDIFLPKIHPSVCEGDPFFLWIEGPSKPPAGDAELTSDETKPETVDEEVMTVAAAPTTQDLENLPSQNSVAAESAPEARPDSILSVPGVAERLKAFSAGRKAALEDLAAKYQRALSARLSQAAAQGDLALASAYREEEGRVTDFTSFLEKESNDSSVVLRPIPSLAELTPESPPELLGLRRVWKAESDKARTSIRSDLMTSLQALEIQLTRQEDIENATKVHAFRQSLAALEVKDSSVGAAEPAPVKAASLAKLPRASRDVPFENSLKMSFVPVEVEVVNDPGVTQTVLFSQYETRICDFEDFAEEHPDLGWSVSDLRGMKDFPTNHVLWETAVKFCEWLTKREIASVDLKEGLEYRLPYRSEWLDAAGVPADRRLKTPEDELLLPWSSQEWPPPKGFGNFHGLERSKPSGVNEMGDYEDDFRNTAEVGSFEPSPPGLYDLSGNVAEWVLPDGEEAESRAAMGGHFGTRGKASLDLRSGMWAKEWRTRTFEVVGFRVVLAPVR